MNTPTIDLSFIIEKLEKSPKLQGTGKYGQTTYYIIKGSKPIAQRMVVIRTSENNQVSFNQAEGIAFRFKFMGELLKWLEENRRWRDGGYFS